jgi:hypothetical protein
MEKFTLDQLCRCAERDVRQRKREYPRLVMAMKMSQDEADREIAMMAEIARRLSAECEANPTEAGRII